VIQLSRAEARGSDEGECLAAVERAARAYAAFTHGNIGPRDRYRAREEARDRLLDALARLDHARGLT
jgi:hypothetical protein